MMKEVVMTKRVLMVIAVLAVAAAVALLIRAQHEQPSVDVVGGSVFISNIIEEVTDGKLESRPFVAPGMCPGHYDMSPSDVRALAGARAFFVHNYQQDYDNVTRVIEAAQNPDLIVWVVNITGNWMTPPVQAQAVNAIAQGLGELDQENAEYYQERAAERMGAIMGKGDEVRARLLQEGLGEVKVICDAMQAGFVMWAGFDVVATYGRPEDLSTSQMAQLVETARDAGVALVIDNLQSGATGNSEALAGDIGAVQVVVSNFPGGFNGTETWEKALDRNIELLLDALDKWRQQSG
jgi:zinc transport system substrate-binding protein